MKSPPDDPSGGAFLCRYLENSGLRRIGLFRLGRIAALGIVGHQASAGLARLGLRDRAVRQAIRRHHAEGNDQLGGSSTVRSSAIAFDRGTNSKKPDVGFGVVGIKTPITSSPLPTTERMTPRPVEATNATA